MTDSDDGTFEPASEWGRRRTNLRHDVGIPAVLVLWGGTRMACRISDISSSGAALEVEISSATPGWKELEAGAAATLEFKTADDAPPCTAAVTIARRDPGSIGVRYAELDQALHEALHAVAARAVSLRVAAFEREQRTMDPDQRRTLQACRKQVADILPNMIWHLRTELGNRLRRLAAGASRADSEAARADAERLESRAVAITRNIEITILQGVAEISDLDQTQELTMMLVRAANTGEALGSGDTSSGSSGPERDYIVALCQAAEQRYKADFRRLCARLAATVGHELDASKNPLEPATLCRIFCRGVLEQAASPRVERLLHEVIMHAVVPLIGELYAGLDRTLSAAESR